MLIKSATIVKNQSRQEDHRFKMKLTDIPKEVREQMMVDEFTVGNAYCLKEKGKFIRIDPMKVKLIWDKEGNIKDWEVMA